MKKHNRHQHNTDDGGQAVVEKLIHVQMSRLSKWTGEGSKQQYKIMRQREQYIFTQHFITETSNKGRKQCLYL